MSKKRLFDLALCIVSAVAWVPTVLFAALLVLLLSGRPVLYASMRKVSTEKPIRIVKFRTMVRNAAEIVNRDTVAHDNKVRFLNIPPDSPLYTRIGRQIERFGVTELPQFAHVLRGQMSIVGNRPLPQNVMDCLTEEYPNTEDRFLTPAGLTGPAQLVGRQVLSDAERLDLEGAYSRGSASSYSMILDLKILLHTVLIVLHLRQGLDYLAALQLIEKHTGEKVPARAAEHAPPDPQPVVPQETDSWVMSASSSLHSRPRRLTAEEPLTEG